ncbi:MAG: efflux RND transporter periplasmic adaptor subunit [Planctomycetia bacterium]|nr:efflux RND transporter periplasmic adaptor subunit [Planctomycetia bacterium]
MRTILHCLAICLCVDLGSIVVCAHADDAGLLRLDNAVVTLIEQVDIPARSAGVLAELTVREGDKVVKGKLAGRIDDAEARLKAEHVELELIAARTEAGNELKLLAMQKGAEAAQAELQRAVDSQAKYDKSISKTELSRLRLSAEKGELEFRQSRHEIEVAKIAVRVKENELAAAREACERHQLTTPIDGVVVEVRRRAGEWVEPGMPVLRIVRMDRLRVEAFLDAGRVPERLAGREVELRVADSNKKSHSYTGRITFVSPEVNPVNGQIRICAEIENSVGSLRPGIQGTLFVSSTDEPKAKTESTGVVR